MTTAVSDALPSFGAHPQSEATAARSTRRPEKDLMVATRAFTQEDVGKGWWLTLSTLAVVIALGAGAVLAPWWPLKVALAFVQGLTMVRLFCIFHDFQHGAILRQSKPAQAFFWLFGEFILTPASVWRESHNYHHAHTAKFVGSHIGSYPVVTLGMWKGMSPLQRTLYKFARHPVNILVAIFTVFTIGMCIRPFLRAPTKHWGGPLSLLLTYGSGAALVWAGYGAAWAIAWLLPMAVAASVGSYLFYVQHNFTEAQMPSREAWTFVGASLDASSYFEMSPLMHWFTANIGYHHVHHLNAAIPFYRLPEAMAQVPEFQQPGRVTWALADMQTAFSLKVYDPEQSKMVGYPAA
jgi:acyl-lipid omega-6 desaturase (Delta-12 desaturase)